MKAVLVLLLAAAFGTARAEPRTATERCPACKGMRSLSLTPPNLGQHDGEIDVTPGKPFTNHRWDVRYNRCPLCTGTGRHELWATKVAPPEDRADKDPCTTCWWSGVEPCRRCNRTGFTECSKCKSSRRGSKPGWIVEEQKTSSRITSRTSRHRKIAVSPCPECSGIGKIPCAACTGMGGQPCRRCKGAGYMPKKGKR